MHLTQVLAISICSVFMMACSSNEKKEDVIIKEAAIQESTEETNLQLNDQPFEAEELEMEVQHAESALHGVEDGYVILEEEENSEDLPLAQMEIIQEASYVESVVTPEVVEVQERVVELNIDEPVSRSSLFRRGFKRFSKDCNMRRNGDTRSSVLGQIERGRKLWVDDHNRSWAKVYRKAGPAFVHKSCL